MRFAILIVVVILAAVAGFAALKFSGQLPATAAPTLEASAPAPELPEVQIREASPSSGEPATNNAPRASGFRAVDLASGMRAVAVAVDPAAGLADLLSPGDRVDVLFAHGAGQPVRPGQPAATASAEVLLAAVKVLAVNVAPESKPLLAAGVTLELSQDDAKRLRMAEEAGSVSLALRPRGDDGDSTVGEPVTLKEITGSQVAAREDAPQGATPAMHSDSVVIIRGVRPERSTVYVRRAAPASAPSQPLSTLPPETRHSTSTLKRIEVHGSDNQ